MCGIVGFIGKEQAAPILLEGLSRLEYRGYDSAGLAVYDREKGLQVVKAKGRLQVLYDLTDGGALVPGVMGVGHTRWATTSVSVSEAKTTPLDSRNSFSLA